MTTAAAPAITYRKTQRGEWVAFGPASAITAGATVMVTKRSGETKAERIASVGKTFTVSGTPMVYGYLVPAQRTSAPRSTASRCGHCRCHAEPGAGRPGTILYDGCDYCGCEAS